MGAEGCVGGGMIGDCAVLHGVIRQVMTGPLARFLHLTELILTNRNHAKIWDLRG